MNEKRAIIVNSTICYVLAFLCTTMFHELAHALAGVWSGSDPVLHHNYVEYLKMDHLTLSQRVGMAMAGPLVSLLQGFMAGSYFLSVRSRGLFQLFLLWLSVLGFNNFLGYIMTAPLFHEGDIGKTYDLLGTPMTLQIIYTLVAAVGLLIVANRMSRPFLEFSYRKSWVDPEKNALNFSFSTIMIPWILGSVLVTILYLPIVNIVSIIYPISSGMIFIYPWQNARRIKNIRLSDQRNTGKLSLILMILFVIAMILFRWFLPPGIRF